ncbi:hypothetical protein [Sediminicoccus sp. BL-A-41-H5]|uniref:hypothetical protein n=1 Tax=Sediminicoccus sp. BL-A-41-H5 TaxID=3421106 RepID=UPI003D678843
MQLLDPDDRDLFPSTALGMALGMPPIVSMPSSNPMRRIGKAPGYDDEFAAVVDAAKAAIQQGSVSVVRTYQPPGPEFRIGMVDLGGFPLDLSMLLELFRTAAADPQFQAAAVQNDKWLFETPERVWAIAEARGSADGGINGGPPLADVTFPLGTEGLREPLSNVARARIGHTIKLTSFCMTQGLVPYGIHQCHDAILRKFQQNSAKFLDQIAEIDPYWNYRNRALKLAHGEYVDFDCLSRLSVQDVLTLRTNAWGRQAEARDALFDAVGQLVRNCSEEADFDKFVMEQIRDYRQRAAEVEDERAALLFKVNCEFGKASLKGAGAMTTVGAIDTLATGLGVAAALVAAAYFSMKVYEDLKPISEKLRQSEQEFKVDARYCIHNFYDKFL